MNYLSYGICLVLSTVFSITNTLGGSIFMYLYFVVSLNLLQNLQPQQITGISAGFKVKMVNLEIIENLADLISYFSLSSDSVYKRIKLQRLR